MEITKQKIEAYLDDLVVKIYLSQGAEEDFEKFHKALYYLSGAGYELRQYRIMESELMAEYIR